MTDGRKKAARKMTETKPARKERRCLLPFFIAASSSWNEGIAADWFR